jgi:hypothetical protein
MLTKLQDLSRNRDFYSRSEQVWDPLDYQDQFGLEIKDAEKLAQQHRREWLKANPAPGATRRVWSLRGQLRPYRCFGEPDGRTRTVYYVTTQVAY